MSSEISGYKNEQVWAQVGENKIWESAYVKLSGITVDKELKFDKYVSKSYTKASRKLSVLARISKFLSFTKKTNIFKMFVESQFNYCLLIWIFHVRYTNN